MDNTTAAVSALVVSDEISVPTDTAEPRWQMPTNRVQALPQQSHTFGTGAHAPERRSGRGRWHDAASYTRFC